MLWFRQVFLQEKEGAYPCQPTDQRLVWSDPESSQWYLPPQEWRELLERQVCSILSCLCTSHVQCPDHLQNS